MEAFIANTLPELCYMNKKRKSSPEGLTSATAWKRVYQLVSHLPADLTFPLLELLPKVAICASEVVFYLLKFIHLMCMPPGHSL